MSIANIEKVLAQADAVDRFEGALAYQRYNETLRKIAAHYGTGFCQTVAAFSALSPNNDYWGNLRSLVTLIIGIQKKRHIENIRSSTYNECKERAHAYLTGEKDFLMCTKGPKTRAFYHNILQPACKKHVTIDGHMYGIYVNERMIMRDVAYLKIPYKSIEDDFKTVARRNKMIPNQLQATLWFTWKRIHNVIYNQQMGLYNHTDQWRLIVDPLEIKPF